MKKLTYAALIIFAGCNSEPAKQTHASKEPVKPSVAETKATPKQETKPEKNVDEKKYLTIEELHSLVKGQTKEEVIKAIGKPDRTEYRKVGIENIDHWIYKKIIRSQYAKTPEDETVLRFGIYVNGKPTVSQINP